jgi:putative ABC transport system permease protein
MTPFKLIISNLRHYWQKNALLAMGVAISAAVLTGALIVGDSVQYSLKRIVEQRLGNIGTIVETGDRYVTSDLAQSLEEELEEDAAPVLLLDGIAVADGGQKRLNHIQVLGIDDSFDQMAGDNSYFDALSGDSVIISENTATRLNVIVGDEILLRITKASLVPLNAPFVSDAENIVSLRVTVKNIAGTENLGRFNLKNSQTSPFNLFISLVRLQELMEIGEKANLILVTSRKAHSSDAVHPSLKYSWDLEDVGLTLRESEQEATIEVISDRIFIDEAMAEVLTNAGANSQPILSYFVNSIQFKDQKTPYSFVSTLPDLWLKKGEIIINTWLAEDLGVEPGDSIWLQYFLMGPLRELTVDSTEFVVKSIVVMDGYFGDKNLMPDIPGLSDAGNCRDWETGVPIKLDAIRDKDERYWTKWKGTPKAFISTSAGLGLWENRFGKYTAFRFPMGENTLAGLSGEIMRALDPVEFGFSIKPVLSQAEYAAENGVDFSGLFGGLSFFLLAGGILLTFLLFLLNLEDRKEQLRSMVVMGIPLKMNRRILILEGMIVALLGAAAGLLLAILYNRLVFSALNGVWLGIVRTEMMVIDIQWTTLLTGFLMTLAVAWLALFFPLNMFLRRKVRQHVSPKKTIQGTRLRQLYTIAGIIFALSGFGLILSQLLQGEIVNPALFFPAGGLLLVSGILLIYSYLQGVQKGTDASFNLSVLSSKNASRSRTRSMSVVILFAIGTFLVISTGSNKKDLFVNAEDPTTGTGGFLYYAESTVPVLQNLNDDAVRNNYGLSEASSLVQLRISDGDDASCLNLNKIVNPRILGVDPEELSGRFSFVTSVPLLNAEDPWSTLSSELSDVIPAIADETVIKWGLGLKVGDTLQYIDAMGNQMNLLLVGGLAPSIFQGNVLISNDHFLTHFPQHSGTEVFLVDGNIQDTAMISEELTMGMRDLGWMMNLAAERLTEFNSITNTYLSIFLVMGALGLLLGTVGLAIVLYRSILERKSEISLLRAVGYSLHQIKSMIIREYMFLLIAGSGIGFLAAIIATLPSILSPNMEVSFVTIILVLIILLLNGWFWSWLLTGSGLKNKDIYTALREE